MTSTAERDPTLVRTGFRRLDQGRGVLHRGRVTLLAGAPSMGKSALAMGMILGACEPESAAAVYFTSFYENGDLLLRLLAATGGVAPARNSQRQHGITAFAEQAQRRGLYLLQGGGIVRQAEQIASLARAAVSRNPGMVALAIDPLLNGSPGTRVGQDERRATLVGIRQIAVELDIAVLLVVALQRSQSPGDGKRPDRAQLPWYGFEPGVADTELLLYRPSIFQPLAPPALAEVTIHQQGEEGHRLVSLRYRHDLGSFEG